MNLGVALFLLAVALVYATVGQAGGTAFLAVMAVTDLVSALAAGQTMAAELPVYAGAALVGAAPGTMIGRRFLSERTTRFVLSGILRRVASADVRLGADTASRVFLQARLFATLNWMGDERRRRGAK